MSYNNRFIYQMHIHEDQEARVALCCTLSNFNTSLQTSHKHPWLDIPTVSLNQFFIEKEFSCNDILMCARVHEKALSLPCQVTQV